jgi:alkyldihydroxyacetonephosphate synthase
MRRWNGWGDEKNEFPLKPEGLAFISERIGAAQPLPDATLATVLAKVPASRLPAHPLIVTAAEDRLRHARGQSLPDWLAMRSGDFGIFPDGVAYPQNTQQVRELLDFCLAKDIEVIPYGGGTSVVGHITPIASARPVLTLSLEKMNRLLAIDRDSQLATFGAGTAGPELEEQLKREGYTLGHFPQSWELSHGRRLGGEPVERPAVAALRAHRADVRGWCCGNTARHAGDSHLPGIQRRA